MKIDVFQGKQKVKDRWNETQYVVVRQVIDGVPAYEVKDEAGNIKTIHYNQLFLVAAPKEAHQFQKKTLFGPPGQNIPC